MHIRMFPALAFFLVVSGVHAQDLQAEFAAQNSGDHLGPDTRVQPAEEQSPSDVPTSDGDVSGTDSKSLPDKPLAVAREGQWLAGGEPSLKFPDGLVMVAKKDDGRLMWHVEKVNSCVWCGEPMTWKKAMFDRKGTSMWVLYSALLVGNIEIMHHMPCFKIGTCKEDNPILGQSRLQAYSVGGSLAAFDWIYTAWARKGDRNQRIGGYRHWWIVPTVGDAAAAIGIIVNLATWHSR